MVEHNPFSRTSGKNKRQRGGTGGSDLSKKRRSVSQEDGTLEMFRPLFADMFEGAQYRRINPFACIRIVKIRPITNGGVMRLMALFSRGYNHPDDLCSVGLSFGTDTPMVVELTGDLSYLLDDHFKNEGLSPQQIEEAISAHDKWYGIIDGGHSNEAVKKLSTMDPRWKGFEWLVTVLNGGHSLNRYRQLARAQNSRHSPRFYVQMTFFDQINNLRLEYDNLTRLQMKPSQIQLARTYFGTTEVSNTRKHLASMAVRLPKRTLDELGVIINEERPADCLKHDSFDCRGATTTEGLQSVEDCRIFRNFITLHSLRMSTIFMNASTDDEIEAQLHTLHRAKEYSLLNGLKVVQYTTINDMFKMSMLAISEVKKFQTYLGSTEWPAQMANVKNNLLRSTILDSEIESNQGNEYTILNTLRQSLMSISPNIVKECDRRLKQLVEGRLSNNNNTEKEVPEEKTVDVPNPPNVVSDSHDHFTPEELEKINLEKDLQMLSSKGIDCINTDWSDYLKTSWTSDSILADTVITEPPSISSRSFLGVDLHHKTGGIEEELSEEEVVQMPKLVKRMLKPGGYIILIIKVEAFGEWYKSFRNAGFTVMPRLYVFAYKHDSVQDRNPTHFPQSGADFGMVAYLPSETTFQPDFNSVFSVIGSRSKRNLALMTEIPAPKSKLRRPGSRTHFLPSEKSVSLLMEVIDLFTPKSGLVVDLYGGTLTTAIAAHIMKRKCLCFEKKSDLFKASVERIIQNLDQPNIIDNSGHHHHFELVPDFSSEQTKLNEPVAMDEQPSGHVPQQDNGEANNNVNLMDAQSLEPIVQEVYDGHSADKRCSTELILESKAFATRLRERNVITTVGNRDTSVVDVKNDSGSVHDCNSLESTSKTPGEQHTVLCENETDEQNKSETRHTTKYGKVNYASPDVDGLQALAAAAVDDRMVHRSGIKRVIPITKPSFGNITEGK